MPGRANQQLPASQNVFDYSVKCRISFFTLKGEGMNPINLEDVMVFTHFSREMEKSLSFNGFKEEAAFLMFLSVSITNLLGIYRHWD